MSGDTLVNADTGEVIAQMTPDEARLLTDRMHTAVGVLTELYVEAYQRQAWAALGYPSWDAYLAAEFGKYQLRLPAEERDETIASMRSAGLSIRAIAATGVASKATVERAIAASGVIKEDTSTIGTDGKKYPATESDAVKAARARREAEAQTEPEWVPALCVHPYAKVPCPSMADTPDGMCAWHRGETRARQQAERAAQGPPDENDGPAPVDAGPVSDEGTDPSGALVADSPSDGTGGRVPVNRSDAAETDSAPVSAAPPVLPTNWPERIANASYLLSVNPVALAAVASPDDIADLTALASWLARFDQAIKEQNA